MHTPPNICTCTNMQTHAWMHTRTHAFTNGANWPNARWFVWHHGVCSQRLVIYSESQSKHKHMHARTKAQMHHHEDLKKEISSRPIWLDKVWPESWKQHWNVMLILLWVLEKWLLDRFSCVQTVYSLYSFYIYYTISLQKFKLH